MKKNKTMSGDSIIEVLLAIAIFSAVAVSSLATMNRGLANVETALEETVARSEIDAQANLIRYIHAGYESTPNNMANESDTYEQLWENITDPDNITDAPNLDQECTNNTPSGFILKNDDHGIAFQRINSYSESGGIPRANGANGTGNDIWIAAARSSDESYYDFYINTCWYSPGSQTGTTLHTTIRLINPDNHIQKGEK